MNKQTSLSFMDDELKRAKTNKKEFLEKIDSVMPWDKFEELVRPCYYKGERGNKPYDLSLMICVYVLQNLYNLSDAATRNEIIDSRAFSVFCDVESSNQIPDGDTIGTTLEGGYIFNVGDRKGTQKLLYGDVTDTISYNLVDRGQYFLKGAIQAIGDNMAMEFGYHYTKSDKVKDNKWYLNMNVEY